MKKLIRLTMVGTFLGISVFTFAGCTTTGTASRHHKSSDYVQIAPRQYNTETRSFDRPWPFGPEGGAQ